MCWHVAKVLRLQGSSEHALLRHIGLSVGSKQGGFWRLKAATEREVHASPDALEKGAQQHSVSNVTNAVQQPQRAQRAPAATPRASSQQVKTAAQHKKEALKALAIFIACKDEWSVDNPDWRWLTVAANKA